MRAWIFRSFCPMKFTALTLKKCYVKKKRTSIKVVLYHVLEIIRLGRKIKKNNIIKCEVAKIKR